MSKNAEKSNHLVCSNPQKITGLTRVPRTILRIIPGSTSRLSPIIRGTLDVRGKSKIDENGITSRIDELDRANGLTKLLWFSIKILIHL